MLDAAELIGAARLLLSSGEEASDGRLRRAISTAYYALFHALLRAGADRFAGASEAASPAYAILYRGFSHGRMKAVCAAVDVARLSLTLQRQLGRDVIHPELRDCARAFIELQRARHLADYDPHYVCTQAGAADSVDQAEVAISAFARAPEADRSDLLAFMLTPARD